MANAPQLTVGLGFDLDEASARKVVKGMEQLGEYLEKSAEEKSKKVKDTWDSRLVDMAKGWIAFQVTSKGFQFTKDLFLLEERFRSMQLPLKNLTEGTGDFGRSLSFITDLADRTGQDLFVLGDGYKGIYASAKQAGIATDEVNKIFSSVVRAGSSLKLSNDQVSLSLKAIEQMMNKGVISSEELRQQLGDHLPGAYALMAKAAQDAGISTSGSTQELAKLLEQGKVASAQVLPFFAKRMEEAFGKNAEANINTISGSANRLNNELTHLIDALDEGKVISFWASIQNGIANTFKDLTYLVNSGSFNEFMGYVTGSSILTTGKRVGQDILMRDFSTKSFKDQVTEFKRLQADFNKAKETSQGLSKAGITPDTSYLTQTAETLKKYSEIIKSAQKTGGTIKPPMSPFDGKKAVEVFDDLQSKLSADYVKKTRLEIEQIYFQIDRLKNSLNTFGATKLPNIFEFREQQSKLGEQLRKSFDITPLGDQLTKSTEVLTKRFESLKANIFPKIEGLSSDISKFISKNFDTINQSMSMGVEFLGDALATGIASIFNKEIKFDFRNMLGQFLGALGDMFLRMATPLIVGGLLMNIALPGSGAAQLGSGLKLGALGVGLKAGGMAISSNNSQSPSENNSYQSQFKGAIGGSQGGFDGGKVVFEIQGTTLKGVLNNTDKVHG